MAVALLENVSANGEGDAVNPDPIRVNTWRRTNTFICYVDTDQSTWDTAAIDIWGEDRDGRTYKPGDSTQLTPGGLGAVIVTIGDDHTLKANVSGAGTEDLYVYAAPLRGPVS